MLQVVIGVLIGVGAFLILADIFRLPSIKASKAYHNLSKRQKKKTSTFDVWFQGLAQFIAKNLKLNEYRRMQLLADLQSAGLDSTPELHIAKAITKASICGILAIPAFFLFPILVPVIITLAFAVYYKESKDIQERIRKKRAAIEAELPRLVFTIQKTLTHSRDVLGMLESYKPYAGPMFREELNITVADMRSGNYETALKRLQSRVGSAMLSEVTSGLQAVLRGDDTIAYWASLSMKLSDHQRQRLKKQAQTVPGKVRRLSMALLFCFILVYLVVIITEIMSQMGVMFG